MDATGAVVPTRLLITGSRDWIDYPAVYDRILGLYNEVGDPLTVVEGGARGVDAMAEQAAIKLGLNLEVYPADWKKYGKAAGPIRNQQMVDTMPDFCYAFIRNNSKGATHCANAAKEAGIPTVIFRSNDNEFLEL